MRSNSRGQAATETMIVMLFLLLMIFGIVHMSMFAATKYMVNLAAFATARTALVEGNLREAATGVMDNLRWWLDPSKNAPLFSRRQLRVRGRTRDGILVVYTVPFGFPIFRRQDIPGGGLRVVGFSPMVVQSEVQDIEEKGDNAAH